MLDAGFTALGVSDTEKNAMLATEKVLAPYDVPVEPHQGPLEEGKAGAHG